MFTQTKKKIYIIGSNPKDFFDLTIESTKILSKSDLIIFSKSFSRKYTNILNYNTKNILYEEDLGSSKQALWKKICELFNNHKIISHLIVGDPYLFFENDQEEFFLKKKIIVEKILGIPEIVNAINKKKYFLTNRNKNSSIIFFFPLTEKDCNKLLDFHEFEKLIIKIKSQPILSKVKKIFKNKKHSKLIYKFYVNGNEKKLFEKINLDKFKQNAYIILENAKL